MAEEQKNYNALEKLDLLKYAIRKNPSSHPFLPMVNDFLDRKQNELLKPINETFINYWLEKLIHSLLNLPKNYSADKKSLKNSITNNIDIGGEIDFKARNIYN